VVSITRCGITCDSVLTPVRFRLPPKLPRSIRVNCVSFFALFGFKSVQNRPTHDLWCVSRLLKVKSDYPALCNTDYVNRPSPSCLNNNIIRLQSHSTYYSGCLVYGLVYHESSVYVNSFPKLYDLLIHDKQFSPHMFLLLNVFLAFPLAVTYFCIPLMRSLCK